MKNKDDANALFEINPTTYEWSIRVFRTIKKLLSVNLKLHGEKPQIEQSDILLFNHFSRFETFIPQYLIYEETGLMCCAVAASEFFSGDDVLSNYLRNVGAIPHDHDQLLSILAKHVLHGRKVIIFPEGGMVKDRQVIDESGVYSVFSRTAMDRRKHHTGAAVLALGLDVFKMAVKKAFNQNDLNKLERWRQEIGFEDVGQLLTSAMRPTRIVPSNITFYPIRVSDNILRKGAELLSEGLTRRHSEELLIEGNILLKDTDMDVRLGSAICSSDYWRPWEMNFFNKINIDGLDDAFTVHNDPKFWPRWLLTRQLKDNAKNIRNEYMHRMYISVTVNLSHLASTIIMAYSESQETEINQHQFHTALYLSVKQIQGFPDIHLHRGLKNPERYRNLIDGKISGLEQFISMAESSGLVEPIGDTYRFLPKLLEKHGFDEVRVENLVEVYANEIEPLPHVIAAVKKAIKDAPALGRRQLADCYFDDEKRLHQWDKEYFSKPCFDEINNQETATETAEPFFLQPDQPNGTGVVLIHGFMASPAELRGFGEKLCSNGYLVISARLKGHGTSPHDLRETSWEQWFESVQRIYYIMQCCVERIVMVGFSTGGALALRLAADQPDNLVAVAAVSVPVKFRDSGMMLIPLLHRTNTLVRWFSSYEGVKPFFPNDTEHPNVNYRNMPVRGLYELRRLVRELEERLGDVRCPTLILQGDNDPVVVSKSAEIIHAGLGAKDKSLVRVRSKRHGVLMDNIDGTQMKVLGFLQSYSADNLG